MNLCVIFGLFLAALGLCLFWYHFNRPEDPELGIALCIVSLLIALGGMGLVIHYWSDDLDKTPSSAEAEVGFQLDQGKGLMEFRIYDIDFTTNLINPPARASQHFLQNQPLHLGVVVDFENRTHRRELVRGSHFSCTILKWNKRKIIQ